MTEAASVQDPERFDAIVVGAGISGMYMLYRLRELGLKVRVLEAGTDVGGTWYWNRYPGARFDSESWSYGYAFSQEILDEWQWSEHFSSQPENLRYCRFVADRLDLKRDIRFETSVTSAHYDEDANEWAIAAEDGYAARARLFIAAIGPLSVPVWPAIDGIGDFEREAYHTARWPHEPVSFAGKRVAVIGTGATGVQLIQEVAKTAGHLTVLQRRPNWCAPLHNSPITPEEQADIRARHEEIFDHCRNTHGGFIHDADPRRLLETPEAERLAFLEKKYAEPGFGIWMGNFRDTFTNEEANRILSDFIAGKIRERVADPATAEKLIPKDHGFGQRRVPMETRYYEVYNQDNVELVDILADPIRRVTKTGIELESGHRDFDMIVYATGFDAVLGGFNRIDIRGLGGQRLRDKWAEGPTTYLGLQVAGFPNMLTLVGPQNAAGFGNIPRGIEQNVEWVARLVRHMRDNGLEYVAATPEAETEWQEEVTRSSDKMLLSKADSWFTGINRNIDGRSRRVYLLYTAGMPAYRERCDAVAAKGYEGMELR
ncbi:flavin-containing monooxygenase [Minwuia thermotolerans]|uniref:Cyclohexanone monooxygenase n=1 Tax=Minwuia thermotolerans TaxID=2056226 RepID=A0A2M9FZU3_9PROT|nr:NAD(P)/FAD-dependent oxidoreductase [Minwuia thermotolerans]PJK28959.1 cyclohexanone monooxygenase [Minwuia thermotolerans]